MHWLKFLLTAAATCLVLGTLNTRIGVIPPLGPFLDPFHGFWQNAETKDRPTSHVAKVDDIKQWKDSGKYVVVFAGPAEKIAPVSFVPKSTVKAPQAPRYTSLERLKAAKNLDEAF